MSQKRRTRKLVPITAALLLLTAGCAGYRLGSMLPPDLQTGYVPTFGNSTTQPLIEMEATQAVIAAFQRDGSLEPVESEGADAVLQVTLTHYDAEPIGFRADAETTADEYRLVMTASVVLRKADGTVVMEHPAIEGDATFLFSGDMALAKREILPEAARDLAHDIVERIVETW